MLKLFLIFLLVFFFAGCATPRVQKESLQLQNRIALLEQELKQKDEQIRTLEEELYQKEVKRRPEEKEITGVTPKRIQKALKNAGFYKGPIDGNIGPQTRQAIKEFQKANGLKADGIVGRRTWEKLSKYLN